MSVNATAEVMRGLMKSGRVYDLGQSLQQGMFNGPTHPPFTFSLVKLHGRVVDAEGVSTANEIFTMGGHVGTHLDGLGHVSFKGRLHGDRPVDEFQTLSGGIRELGMETVAPIVRRGVLFDVPGYRGVSALEGGEPVGADELAAISAKHGFTVERGDVAFIRTGWIRHWEDHTRFFGRNGGIPGPTVEAARWLVERGVSVVGGDSRCVEWSRGPQLPVHHLLLVDAGVHLLEMANLEALAADSVRTFLCVILPLKLVGATGSPVRPIAIV